MSNHKEQPPMAKLANYRVGKNCTLSEINPDTTPFLHGDESDQRRGLEAQAVKLDALQDLLHANQHRKLLVVLQGMDTSGKDGTIRWVFSRTSPLGVRVASFKAPTEEERGRDYLWRCLAVVPRSGELMVWNRSHYEDVLLPPVMGWIDKTETKRRYAQINAFELMLTQTGTTILKIMLHISKNEQKERLQARIDDPAKNWKFSLGDLNTRKQWDLYQNQYEKALAATSTKIAPWYVVPANDKLHRNVMIAQLLVSTLKEMKLKAPKANPQLEGLVVE